MGLHIPELIIVLVVALLLFGPKKLPEMGSAIGKSVKAFRKGINEISNPGGEESSNPSDADLPEPASQDALPISRKDSSIQASTPSTSDKKCADKQAD